MEWSEWSEVKWRRVEESEGGRNRRRSDDRVRRKKVKEVKVR